jgi:flagellar biosynthesis/type III secretory pathway chaperone
MTEYHIKTILSGQITGYRLLMDLLRKERECLININTGGVEEISKEKDTIILRLRLLEEERIRLINKFVQENGIEGDLSLQKLSSITGDDAFVNMRLQLISLMQGITELNEFNRILIERSMNFVRNTARFFGSAGMNVNAQKAGSVISREV